MCFDEGFGDLAQTETPKCLPTRGVPVIKAMRDEPLTSLDKQVIPDHHLSKRVYLYGKWR
jgi:hypothetical protein